MPVKRYGDNLCPDGHIEVDRDRTCLRCDKPLYADDIVAVHVNRDPRHPRGGGENAHSEDIATESEWGPLG